MTKEQKYLEILKKLKDLHLNTTIQWLHQNTGY